MPKLRSEPNWEFLLTASRATLQSYEFSRLTLAANLRKEIVTLLDQVIDETTAALVARALLNQPARGVLDAERETLPGSGAGVTLDIASDNVFENRRAG
jgi:hypothetical protein